MSEADKFRDNSKDKTERKGEKAQSGLNQNPLDEFLQGSYGPPQKVAQHATTEKLERPIRQSLAERKDAFDQKVRDLTLSGAINKGAFAIHPDFSDWVNPRNLHALGHAIMEGDDAAVQKIKASIKDSEERKRTVAALEQLGLKMPAESSTPAQISEAPAPPAVQKDIPVISQAPPDIATAPTRQPDKLAPPPNPGDAPAPAKGHTAPPTEKIHPAGKHHKHGGHATPTGVSAPEQPKEAEKVQDTKSHAVVSKGSVEARKTETSQLSEELVNLENKYGKDSPHIVDKTTELANSLTKHGHYAEAEPLFQQAMQIVEKASGNESLAMAKIVGDFADLYYLQNRFTYAEPLVKQAIAIERSTLPANDPLLYRHLETYARVLYKTSRFNEAKPIYDELKTMKSAQH